MARAGAALLTFSLIAAGVASSASAQAPLGTDDAAVAPHRRVHIELFQQVARLPRSARPAEVQNTLVFTAGYGVTPRLELGFDIPLITVGWSSRRTTTGIGDINLTGKYIVLQSIDARRPALALAGAVELPSGDERRGFGSGVTDYSLNAIVEQPLRGGKTTLRGNAGVQFAGNTLTGLIGIRDRGTVVSAGTSVTRSVSERWQIGAELTGYQGRSPTSGDRELRAQVSATRALNDALGISIAAQRGWLATPPFTLQFGFALDLQSRSRAKHASSRR